MVQPFKSFLTLQEYLTYEETAPYKSEYHAGKVYLMAGGSRNHNRIALNIASRADLALGDRDCEVFINEMKVFVASENFSSYPDVIALCEEPNYLPGRTDTITNPSVIFEVLFKSTSSYDRGDKFEFYQGLESLQQYVLVEQKKVRVESYVKQSDKSWQVQFYTKLEESLPLPTLGIELPLSQIYRKVKFPERKRPIIRPLKPNE